MLREELISAVDNVIAALTDTGFYSFSEEYGQLAREDTSKIAGLLLDSHVAYKLKEAQFSEVEHKVIELIDLSYLGSTSKLLSFLEETSDRLNPGIWKLCRSILFVKDQLPKILLLLKRESIDDSITKLGDLEGESAEILRVILIEPVDAFSGPDRIIQLLESIKLLYEVYAAIENLTDRSLVVAACDSGSDKEFDFTGLSQIIGGVRGTILDIWDRVIFYKEAKTSKQNQLISESLPVIEKISEMEKQGSLERSQAEKLRRTVIAGATKFIEVGAVIPEIDERRSYNPRTLMAPQPKLLVDARDKMEEEHDKDQSSEVQTAARPKGKSKSKDKSVARAKLEAKLESADKEQKEIIQEILDEIDD